MEGIRETTQRFREAINQTTHRIAIDTYHKQQKPEQYHETLDQAHEAYYRSMKGTTNTHQTDIDTLIDSEMRRQKKLHERIEELAPYFDSVKPLDPTNITAYPYWDHEPSHGLNIEINQTRFYAAPRVPCNTKDYATLKQAPVPANIVYINKDMILMRPYREDPSEKTRRQLNKLLETSGKVTEETLDAPLHVKKNYLWTNSEKKIDEFEINRLITKYSVDAFVVGYPSSNIAIIYTGQEETMERLWKESYFSVEVWRRYGRY